MGEHLNITFLGTGTSHGVPSLDCMIDDYSRCPKDVCRLSLTDLQHKRTRSSILVEKNGKTILVDISADFREQALRNEIRSIDAVLITHGHADHICGIPDIRSYTKTEPLYVYGSSETLETVQSTFPYIFDSLAFQGGGIPKLITCVIDSQCEIAAMNVTPIPVIHGTLIGCVGFRIENIAYIPDIKYMDQKYEELLRGLDCLILNCLRDRHEHSTHLILPQSMELARRLGPKRCYFIHMSHDIHYQMDSGQLDSWMAFSYDGLQVQV